MPQCTARVATKKCRHRSTPLSLRTRPRRRFFCLVSVATRPQRLPSAPLLLRAVVSSCYRRSHRPHDEPGQGKLSPKYQVAWARASWVIEQAKLGAKGAFREFERRRSAWKCLDVFGNTQSRRQRSGSAWPTSCSRIVFARAVLIPRVVSEQSSTCWRLVQWLTASQNESLDLNALLLAVEARRGYGAWVDCARLFALSAVVSCCRAPFLSASGRASRKYAHGA